MDMKTSTQSRGLVCANLVADEVLVESVAAQACCPHCGAGLNKAVFVDGDEEPCTACGAALWFEIRDGSVHPHRVQQETQGSSLGELLRSRQLRAGS